ncbi:hypothetical protein LCL95_09710 [Bacillus timonensis]|nr:hypothetical protein [Bacillus timonensis]
MYITAKLKYYWHGFWYMYHHVHLDGCIDQGLTKEMKDKMNKHYRARLELLEDKK